jgi:hypothetical protein
MSNVPEGERAALPRSLRAAGWILDIATTAALVRWLQGCNQPDLAPTMANYHYMSSLAPLCMQPAGAPDISVSGGWRGDDDDDGDTVVGDRRFGSRGAIPAPGAQHGPHRIAREPSCFVSLRASNHRPRHLSPHALSAPHPVCVRRRSSRCEAAKRWKAAKLPAALKAACTQLEELDPAWALGRSATRAPQPRELAGV